MAEVGLFGTGDLTSGLLTADGKKGLAMALSDWHSRNSVSEQQ
jgi:hypothetical protein